jgi:putative transposase
MTNIRRYYLKNVKVFLTAVCSNRKKYLENNQAKELLKKVILEVSIEKDFNIIAFVLMDDHFHWIIDLSGNLSGTLTYRDKDWNISEIMQSVKLRFARRFRNDLKVDSVTSFWQRRFWDHIIRNQHDFNRHLDYIHYNPVKHGAANRPDQYSWSSFRDYLERGYYQEDWGEAGPPSPIKGMEFE